MPNSPERKTSKPRRAPQRRGKRKPGRSAPWRRVPVFIWKLLPVIALGLFALVAFVLDPAAVIQLAWACVSGVFGSLVQVGVAAVLLGATAATVWAFWPEPLPQARASNRSAAPRRPRARPVATREQSEAGSAAAVAAPLPSPNVAAAQPEAAPAAATTDRPQSRRRSPKQTTRRAAAAVTRPS